MSTKTLNGHSDEHSGYSTTDTINNYENRGYELVSDQTNGDNIVFDHDDSVNQYYEVHLKHGSVTVTPEQPGKPGQPINEKDPNGVKYPKGTDKDGLTHVVNQTIEYVNSDGTPLTNDIQPEHHDSLTFEETKVIDKVTGHVTSDTWSPAQSFPAVQSPTETGYTPDKSGIPVTSVSHDTQDITETVTYHPDAQKAIVYYIDDTTHHQVGEKDLNGHSNEHSGYSTTNQIREYEGQNYVLVSDDTNGQEIVFDHDDGTDQSYAVHLNHATEPVSDTKTVTRVIHYRYDNGTPAHPDSTQTVTFTRTGTKDKVTNHTSWNPWTPTNETMTSLVPPTISGYTPNMQLVPSTKVTADSHDSSVTVVYTKETPKNNGTVTNGQPSSPDGTLKNNGNFTGPQPSTPDESPSANGLSTSRDHQATNGMTDQQRADQKLPQTGDHQNDSAIAGLGLATVLAFLGLGKTKKKHE